MKKLVYFFLFTLAFTNCQQVKSDDKAVLAVPAAVSTVSADSLPPVQAVATVADSLTPEMLGLLQQFDLSPLWLADTAHADGIPLLNGFFGPDHQYIALIIDKVQRDAAQPQIFHVRGRDRFQKVVTPFEGTIRINCITDFDSCYVMQPEEDSAKTYTAKAFFTFRQVQQDKDYGVFSGTAFLDFYITIGLTHAAKQATE